MSSYPYYEQPNWKPCSTEGCEGVYSGYSKAYFGIIHCDKCREKHKELDELAEVEFK